MELFRLFGRILVDNDDANRSIAQTTERADGLRGNFNNLMGTVGKWGAAVATAAGTAAIALGTTAFNATENLNKALNGLQASTGIGTEGMQGMKHAMLEIYNNNFGQSFEDIGLAMQTIAQQTKLVSDELSNTTQNALLIRDTFNIDVNESIKAVNQLMKNFGLSSTQAYNLLAQGAQSGLNANNNLADSINEYSVHFSQIGLDANDMFNMFKNGANSGVFDIDKLGDAVKEFGIRVKDNSTGTNEAFTRLGFNAQAIGAAFAKGGQDAQIAFETVTNKLNEVKDPLAQNTIGVQLFGTMWEDIGAKGIAALTNTEGAINKNVDALGKINQVKYDTFGEAISGISRQLETGILIPIGQKILPILQNMANWFALNMPLISDKINIVIDSVVEFTQFTIKLMNALTPLFAGIAAGAITFGTYQLAINAATIATTVWTAATTAATAVGSAFSAVLGFILSPIGLVVVAIGALTAAGVLLYQNWDTVKAFLATTWEWLKNNAIYIFNLIKDTIVNTFTVVKDWINNKFTDIKNIFVNSVETFKKLGSDMFNAMWDGIKNVWDNLSGWINSKVTWLTDKLSFWRSSQNEISGGTTPKARAVGGPVIKNNTYLVGEKGPELFVPNQSGNIIPNNKLSSSGTNIVINITGNNVMGDREADRFGEIIVNRLKALGVT